MAKRQTRYSIPFNGDLALTEELVQTGGIYEVYSAGPEECDLSYQCGQSRSARSAIEKLFFLGQKYRIRINILINSPCLSFRSPDRIIKYLREMRGKTGPFVLTLSDPYQVAPFKKEFPGAEIEASVIMDLDTAPKAEKILRRGVRTVNIPLGLNREMKELKSISRLKKFYPDFKMKLIVNHVCYYGCPFTSHHYFYTEMERGLGLRSDLADPDRCVSFSKEGKELLKRPFIRPEDVPYYEQNGAGDVFKILWRHSPSPVLRRTVRAYLEKSYTGNLFDIVETHEKKCSLYCDNTLFPSGFAGKVTGCDKSLCRNCSYCGRLGQRIIRKLKKADERKKNAG